MPIVGILIVSQDTYHEWVCAGKSNIGGGGGGGAHAL